MGETRHGDCYGRYFFYHHTSRLQIFCAKSDVPRETMVWKTFFIHYCPGLGYVCVGDGTLWNRRSCVVPGTVPAEIVGNRCLNGTDIIFCQLALLEMGFFVLGNL